jgi:hypothetical protein
MCVSTLVVNLDVQILSPSSFAGNTQPSGDPAVPAGRPGRFSDKKLRHADPIRNPVCRPLSVVDFFDRKIRGRKLMTCGRIHNLLVHNLPAIFFALHDESDG